MGANGIDIGSGFTTPDIEEGLIKETAINKSYMAFVLADHSKFRRVYSVTFALCKMLYNHRQTAYAGLFAGNGDKGGKK